MIASAKTQPTTTATIVLRTDHSQCHLVYVVEIETLDMIYPCCRTENYNKALATAKDVFNKVKTKHDASKLGSVATLIENLNGQGVSYDTDCFSFEPSFEDSESLYYNLSENLLHAQSESKTNNEIFRDIVIAQKLNEYQEHRFLEYLKAKKYV